MAARRDAGNPKDRDVDAELIDEELGETQDDYEAGHAAIRRRSGWQGTSGRSKRVRLAVALRFLELRREQRRLVADEVEARSRISEADLYSQAVEDVTRSPLSEETERYFDDWAPTSTVNGCPVGALESIVHRAVLMLPGIHWLYAYLCRPTGKRGYRGAKKCVAATFLAMAFSRGRAEVWSTRLSFVGAALRCWAWEYPEDDVRPVQSRQNFYAPLHEMLARSDVGVVQQLMVEHYLKVARQVARLDGQGNPVYRHPRAGVALIADGSFEEADVPQEPSPTEEIRLILVGTGRENVHFITYGSDGRFTRKASGYRLVVLVDLATGLPVIADLVPNNQYEPKVVLTLLERLFALAPDFPPVKYLIGDRLYGHPKEFLRELIFSMGIQPVFPWRRSYVDQEFRGTPHCDCQAAGIKDTCERRRRLIPMAVISWADRYWDQARRLDSVAAADAWDERSSEERANAERPRVMQRVQPCSEAERKVRLRYKCPRCGSARTSVSGAVWEDPGVVTYLPHAGTTGRAALRSALLLRRNSVESVFAALARLGLGAKGIERPAWARDVEMRWLVLTGTLFLTARRLVFENGLYDYAVQEADWLGLLEPLTLLRPDSGLDPDRLWQARAQRTEVLLSSTGACVADFPETWPGGTTATRRLASLLGWRSREQPTVRALPAIGEVQGDDVEVAAVPRPPRAWALANPGVIYTVPFGSTR